MISSRFHATEDAFDTWHTALAMTVSTASSWGAASLLINKCMPSAGGLQILRFLHYCSNYGPRGVATATHILNTCGLMFPLRPLSQSRAAIKILFTYVLLWSFSASPKMDRGFEIGVRVLSFGYWAMRLGIGHWVLGSGDSALGFGHCALGIGHCRLAHSRLQVKARRGTCCKVSEESVWRKRYKFHIVFVTFSVRHVSGVISRRGCCL